jgi:futalosine hydrolase
MNILLVVATKLEIKPFIAKINYQHAENEFIETIQINNNCVDILITGIGLVFTAYKFTKALNKKSYDFVIHAGIAGSFNRNLNIGDAVIVEQEEFADLGIEESSGFNTIFEKGFLNNNEFPFEKARMKCNLPESIKNTVFKRVRGISSNTAHGNDVTIRQIKEKFKPDIETMESAAFFYVCLMEKVNFIEIRTISNYVETRNPSKWDIPLATENLSMALFQIINAL